MLKEALGGLQRVFDWFYWKRRHFADWRFRRSLRKKGDQVSRDSCPSCGADSSYGPDEDGDLTCLRCGGPTYCEKCREPVWNDPVDGAEGFACEGCGAVFHDRCFPKNRGSDSLLCDKCVEGRAA